MSDGERREQLLTLAALVRADSADEMRFRFEALKAVAGLGSERDELDRWTVLAKVEDVAGFRSDDEILGALVDMGVIEQSDDRVRLVDSFTLASVMGDDRRETDVPCALSLVETLEASAQEAATGAGILAMIDAVRLARQRIREMWSLIQEGHDRSVAGVQLPPTFWRWEKRGSPLQDRNILAPWGAKPSTYTVLDMYRILIHPLLTVPLRMLGLTDHDAAADLAFATGMIDDTVGTCIGTHPPEQGDVKVYFTPNDDDYPGALHPVVPSNAALLLTLALEKEAHGRFGLTPPDRAAWVAHLVRFLVDQRNEDGTWGVYRFPDRSSGVPAFTSLTLRALMKSAQCWPETEQTARSTLDAAPQVLETKLVPVETGRGTVPGIRTGFAAQGRYSPTETLDLIDAVASIDSALRWPEETMERYTEVAETAMQEWTLIRSRGRDNVYTVSFQAPYESGPAPATTTWEQPGHARTLVSLISLVCHASIVRPFDFWSILQQRELRVKVDDAMMLIMVDHDRGCWYDFNLPDCVFPSNMIYYIEAICDYLSAVLDRDQAY